MSQPKPLPPQLSSIEGLKRGSTLSTGTLPAVPTGFGALDDVLGGGIPAGRLTEIHAPAEGKASFLLSLAVEATRRGGTIAWIDPSDGLEIRSAQAAGLDLARVLWVRPQGVPKAIRAVDLVLGSDGFMLAIVDLPKARGPGIHLDPAAWNRLARRAEACGVALVVATERPLLVAAASLGLDVGLSGARWQGSGPALTLEGVMLEVTVRHRKGGAVGFTGRFPLGGG